jgi:bacterioferritin-associated ferredoxin
MSLDREVCLCFHVTLRKLLSFLRIERPKQASQLSECFGAGTGCGWCRPILQKMFEQAQSSANLTAGYSVDSQQTPPETPLPSQSATGDGNPTLSGWEELTDEEYAARRDRYIAQGKGQPPQFPRTSPKSS